MSKFAWAKKKKPAGWELIEGKLEEFDTKLREAINDGHEGVISCPFFRLLLFFSPLNDDRT